ncbi:NUDIX hydrolase, MutT [Oceanicola granulosus HTCC2516]|uniref:NUDIX hydrolase, MutT n=1 Tax=Oceanicola granulosus (strain ATCC BAA-861 / DSM 15982 / KCTC 12143 / HTCC2516) TaxID=314256 RepID=Q2CFL6_OCEGH|nr:NUDIX domain-containing protein [Oceanicola granulosus]EAR51466.1 NUDIX hydrolase, MutT [Oceanicola granulosus HTCC2516]
MRPIRLSLRAVLVREGRLLLVNAYRGRDDLWCAPGGGAEPHQSLPDNLAREVHEETGLTIAVGELCLVNEFHDPERAFHQVDLYFRCTIVAGACDGAWRDPEGIVSMRRWVTRAEIAGLRVKPDSLAEVAWSDAPRVHYDPLERLLP